jgi:hypothetical protein
MIQFLEDIRGMPQSSLSRNSLFQHTLISLPSPAEVAACPRLSALRGQIKGDLRYARKDTGSSIHDSNGSVRPHPHPHRPLPLQLPVSLIEQIPTRPHHIPITLRGPSIILFRGLSWRS